MYKFSVISLTIKEDIFSEICFNAVNDAKLRNRVNAYIPLDLHGGVFSVREENMLNLDIINNLKNFMNRRNYISGKDYQLNIFIEN